jgi:hypothetical protein
MKLRPYQQEVARAVLHSVRHGQGLTFSVEIARQGGKNELSAHLELLLLTLYMARGGNLVKCSPTFKPQTIISMQRLKQRLDEFGFDGIYQTEMGYIIALGNARQIFLSAEPSSSVVGHTADILLEIDESQDVSKEKYSKEFRPMGSSANVTTLHYGTTWDDSTLLEEIKQMNLDLEKRDGVRRHFRYDWQQVARYNPEYGRFVEAEKNRLGEDHPLFRTQYALLPIEGRGRLLSRQQIALMLGSHQRSSRPEDSKVYVAGIDLAGESQIELSLRGTKAASRKAWQPGDPPVPLSLRGAEGDAAISPGLLRRPFAILRAPARNDQNEGLTTTEGAGARNGGNRGHDSTVITVAELAPSSTPSPFARQGWPELRVVEQYQWTGMAHSQLYSQMLAILRNWDCQRIVVDATGIGQPVASFLRKELGSRVKPFTLTQKSKSSLGFELLSFINSGRLKLYRQDGSPEYQETMFQLDRARASYHPNQLMSFYVDPGEGHDDFLISLALLAAAASDFSPRQARGSLRTE